MFDVVHDRLKIFEPFLQQNVHINIEHKTVRKGKLLLYNINEYYIKFVILTNKDITKTYEVPFPYKMTAKADHLKLSYKIEDLCRGNVAKEEFIRTFEPVSNKLYDKTMRIVRV